MTGSTHAKHRSARGPRPTPKGPARDNPIAGPRTGRRGVSLAPLPRRGPVVGTMSPVLGRPPRAPRSDPVEPGAQAPAVGEGTTATGKLTGAARETGPDEARRINAGPRGTPERQAAGHTQGTREGAKQQRPPGVANPGSAHNMQRTTAQEQMPGKSEPTHHKPQPGVAGRSRNPSPSTHTHNAHPSQEWRGTGGAHTPAHTHPNTPARRGGAQPRPEAKHTHPRRTPRPGVAGYKQSADTSTHTAQHPSQEWRGAAETGAQAHTPTPHTPARSGGVQGERPHHHTHTPTPQAGVARRSRNPSQANTPTPHTPARSGGVQAGHAHKQTQTPTTQPGVAKRSRNPSPNTDTHTAHPSQEWRGTGGARTPTRTPQHPSQEWRGAAKTRAQTPTAAPQTPARSCGVQGERPHHHTHTPAPQPGVVGRNPNSDPNTPTHAAHASQEWLGTRGARTQTSTPKHPSEEWRGAAKTRAQTPTPTPHTRARSGGVQGERPDQHTHTPTS